VVGGKKYKKILVGEGEDFSGEEDTVLARGRFLAVKNAREKKRGSGRGKASMDWKTHIYRTENIQEEGDLLTKEKNSTEKKKRGGAFMPNGKVSWLQTLRKMRWSA